MGVLYVRGTRQTITPFREVRGRRKTDCVPANVPETSLPAPPHLQWLCAGTLVLETRSSLNCEDAMYNLRNCLGLFARLWEPLVLNQHLKVYKEGSLTIYGAIVSSGWLGSVKSKNQASIGDIFAWLAATPRCNCCRLRLNAACAVTLFNYRAAVSAVT